MISKFSITILVYSIVITAGSYAGPDPGRFDSFLGSEWYGLYMQGAKTGYAEMRLEKVDAPTPGWRTTESMTMILSALGNIDTIRISDTRFYTSPGGELYSSKMKYASVSGEMIVEGMKEADEYIVSITLAGQATKKTFDYPVDNLDNSKKPNLMLAAGEISTGDSIYSTYFEATPPLTGQVHTNMKLESVNMYNFNGVPTEVYNVSFLIPEMGFTGSFIFDKTGRELEFAMGGGIVLKLEGKTQAMTIDNEYDILSDNLIHPQMKIKNPSSLNFLELEISGIDSDNLLRTAKQAVSVNTDNTLNMKIYRSEPPDTILNLPIDSEDVRPYLEPDVYIQSDAEMIVSRAKSIVGGEKNSWEAAKKINLWVFENIAKEFTPDFSNALQTLNTGKGDCGEHTALATALMRAAGIPARPVTGLTYWPPGEGFGYHAWVEVFVGKWVMMDPAWGENLINPSHIALSSGDIIETANALLNTMGKMRIEILAAR